MARLYTRQAMSRQRNASLHFTSQVACPGIVTQVRLYARAAAPCGGHRVRGEGQFKAIVEPHGSGTRNQNHNLVLYEDCEPTYRHKTRIRLLLAVGPWRGRRSTVFRSTRITSHCRRDRSILY
ncbi:hypothetical protein E2C01_000832 [Portunus trituberculatus]|uniref:Uncharacterized protein n=1 Tax=Portunus trituberculatus TaxID=210409 RepID=A0A5B7CKZ8_PORTR|nr:hypothetical protein [Portunus trituberculatus]